MRLANNGIAYPKLSLAAAISMAEIYPSSLIQTFPSAPEEVFYTLSVVELDGLGLCAWFKPACVHEIRNIYPLALDL